MLARHPELKSKRSEASEFTPLTAEERNTQTMEMLAKHFKKLGSTVGKLWHEAPPEKRSLDVLRSLVGKFVAGPGFAKEFMVSPASETGESNRLVKRLEARAARARRTGRKQRTLPLTEDLSASISEECGGLAPAVAGSMA